MQRKFEPRIITEEFFPEFLLTPKEINYGKCFVWASLANRIFPGSLLYDTCVHAFVKVGSKFYDSERLEGVENWRDLPATRFVSGCGLPYCPHLHQKKYNAMHLPIKLFRSHWRTQPERFGTTWEEIDQKAKRFLKEHQ